MSQALPAPKQLNLNKLSYAGGSQIQWLSDAGKNRFFRLFVYIGDNMAKDPQILQFLKAKSDTVENLDAIQVNLSRCVSEGMIDTDDTYYNEISSFIDEASIADTWDELEEVIMKAKTLEVDVAVWLSGHGQTSLSLPWPKRPRF